jgi:hypothetical protein
MWENTLEKLKILNYEAKFILPRRKKFFSPAYFVVPAKNLNTQFEDFVDLAFWLINELSKDGSKREPIDDPNTTCNKLLLTLRQVEYVSNFSVQKLRIPYGEVVCDILNFLTDKLLEKKDFQWKPPDYTLLIEVTFNKLNFIV